MAADWILIAQADEEGEAYLAEGVLRTNQIDFKTGDAKGYEAELDGRTDYCFWVPPSQADDARRILCDWMSQPRPAPVREGCGRCGSKDLLGPPKLTVWEWIGFVLLFPLLRFMIRDTVQQIVWCERCGHRWRITKAEDLKKTRGFAVVPPKEEMRDAASVNSSGVHC